MNLEIGKQVYRTSRGEPIMVSSRVNKTDTAEDHQHAADITETLDRLFGRDEEIEEITIDRRDPWEVLRAQVVRPITARASEGLPENPLASLTCFGGGSDE